MLIPLLNEVEHIFYLGVVYVYLLLVETFNLCKNEPGRSSPGIVRTVRKKRPERKSRVVLSESLTSQFIFYKYRRVSPEQ